MRREKKIGRHDYHLKQGFVDDVQKFFGGDAQSYSEAIVNSLKEVLFPEGDFAIIVSGQAGKINILGSREDETLIFYGVTREGIPATCKKVHISF